MLIDFKSKWFQAYCRAVLQDDREIAQVYIEDALAIIEEAGRSPVGDAEREAMDVAKSYLTLIREEVELRKAR